MASCKIKKSLEIQHSLPNINGGSDSIQWISKDHFDSSLTWQKIRVRAAKVPWYHFVWFTEAIPRHCFFTWLAVLNRLSTRDRQLSWNPMGDSRCVLCGGVESRDHLFFQCPFSCSILNAAMIKIGKHCPSDWPLLLDWGIKALKRRTAINLVAKMVLQACIYGVWKERNSRIHTSTAHSAASVASFVLQITHDRLAGFLGSKSLYTQAISYVKSTVT